VRSLEAFKTYLADIGLLDEVRAIARKHGTTIAQIYGSRKFRHVTDARAEAMLLLKERFPRMSYPGIATVFGRDHSSAFVAMRRAKSRNDVSNQEIGLDPTGPRVDPAPAPSDGTEEDSSDHEDDPKVDIE
jgi:chromosomal replication initiation ATPase DnaA